jgi:hypothetical protein
MAAVLDTWLWAFVRRLPSTEEVGELLQDGRWQRRLGLKGTFRGCPDTAARALEHLDVEELNELLLEVFFRARRAGLLKGGAYGVRCAAVDMNELFSSTARHCPDCQVREKRVAGPDGTTQVIEEYFHQAVALIWVDGDQNWPLGWELLRPGEGELTAALRLLERVLPRMRGSLDLVLGDGLYCCRPFFGCVTAHGIDALAISSGVTEMDGEIEELQAAEKPRELVGKGVVVWELESEAWRAELKRSLRVADFRRVAPAKPWKHVRHHLRVVSTCAADAVPTAQHWQIGRSRWRIENGTFNLLTREVALARNFHHERVAIHALLVLRALALALLEAYLVFATARSAAVPRRQLWFRLVFVEDWVRYLDSASRPDG